MGYMGKYNHRYPQFMKSHDSNAPNPSRSSAGKLEANFSSDACAGSKCSASEVMFRMLQEAWLKMPQIFFWSQMFPDCFSLRQFEKLKHEV